MPGFATYPFGIYPFGYDPIVPHGPRGAFLPAALEYDGNTQDWAVDADGRHKSLHPVDSGVQLAMFVQKGEFKSSPTTGNTLLDMRELATPRQQAEVEQLIRQSNPIAAYLADGSITIRQIDCEYRASTGALLVQLHYRNNITGNNETARYGGA
jgi:hypothetical protein